MNSNTFSKKFLAVAASLAAGLAFTGAAHADGWPASVAGSWTIVANQVSSTLVLSQGAPGPGSQCLPIHGTVFGDTVQGFYCPGSGRIAFKRGISLQTYVGNLSQAGTVTRMGGTWLSLGGSFGEYEFYAQKLPN
jgi:hypothetical protein